MPKFVIVSQLSSLVLFFLFVLGVECGHHKTTGGVALVLVLVHALVPPMCHLGPFGNQILITKFYKNEIWKKLKLGLLRWQLKFRHNISMGKIFFILFLGNIIWSSIEHKWVGPSPSSCGDLIPPMSTWVMSTYVHVTTTFKLWKKLKWKLGKKILVIEMVTNVLSSHFLVNCFGILNYFLSKNSNNWTL